MSVGQVNLSLGQQGNTPDLQVVSVRSVNQLPGMKTGQMCFVTLMATYRRELMEEIVLGLLSTRRLFCIIIRQQ